MALQRIFNKYDLRDIGKKLIIWSNNTKPRTFTIPKPHIHNHTSFGSHLNHIGIHISKLHIHNLSHP